MAAVEGEGGGAGDVANVSAGAEGARQEGARAENAGVAGEEKATGVQRVESGGTAKSAETSDADEGGDEQDEAGEGGAVAGGAAAAAKKKKKKKKKKRVSAELAVVVNGEDQGDGAETEDTANDAAGMNSTEHSTDSGGDESDCYMSDEDEGKDGYKKGGYHPVRMGETYNSSVVVRKLGWGHFST
ncbi:hypothetical protein T484DRAFT_1764407, partial [Baffinella frigidus]